MNSLSPFLETSQTRIESFLEEKLPAPLNTLAEAVRYTTLSGGKRLRATLVYALGDALGASWETLDAPAAALECLHAYSLVHDDLPAMDDDDFRRGKPSCHRQFGEAMAILVGDALQSLAFELLSDNPSLSAEAKIQQVAYLAQAAGPEGMVLGQAQDILDTGMALSELDLIALHEKKTGALMGAALAMGALSAQVMDKTHLQEFYEIGISLGLVFQIQDDILDATADDATLGKPAGSDAKLKKTTYYSLLGAAGAREKALTLCEQIQSRLGKLEASLSANLEQLKALSTYMVKRLY